MSVERPVPGPGHCLAHHLVLPAGLSHRGPGHLDQGAGKSLTLVPGALPDQVLVRRLSGLPELVTEEDFHVLEHLRPSVLHTVDFLSVQEYAVVYLPTRISYIGHEETTSQTLIADKSMKF